MHALIFAMADDVALRLGARDHLFHVAPAHTLERLAGQDMDVPGLGVHRRWCALGNFDDLLDHGPRHRLFLEAANAAAGLHQSLEIHSRFPYLVRQRLRAPERETSSQNEETAVKSVETLPRLRRMARP